MKRTILGGADDTRPHCSINIDRMASERECVTFGADHGRLETMERGWVTGNPVQNSCLFGSVSPTMYRNEAIRLSPGIWTQGPYGLLNTARELSLQPPD